jgi:EAL domain-containing protein (putative c-di-GMP-specific phosphodiesterase class I)
MGASDFATDTLIAVMTGLMTGVGAPQEIVTQLQEHRKDVKAQMQNSVEFSMSVTYHGVTRPELLQYAKEVGAQPLKGFYLQVDKSFVEIVQERALALGQDLKEAIAARKN